MKKVFICQVLGADDFKVCLDVSLFEKIIMDEDKLKDFLLKQQLITRFEDVEILELNKKFEDEGHFFLKLDISSRSLLLKFQELDFEG